MKRILLSTMLLAAVSANAFAGGTQDMGAHQQSVQHAEPAAMPIASIQACEPAVKEGQWTFTARAGIAPTSSKKARITRTFTFTDPGEVVTFPTGNHHINEVDGFNRSSYNVKSNGLPYTFGIDLGYVPMDNVEVFFAFDYVKANGKKRTIHNKFFSNEINPGFGTYSDETNLVSKYKQGDFSSYGFYLGGRYFFDMDCKFSPFVGAKLGLVYRTHGKHKIRDVTKYSSRYTDVLGNQLFSNTDVRTANYKIPLYKNSTGFSGGLQAGFNYRVTEQVSLIAMAEVVGSTSLKTHKKRNLVFRDATNGATVYSQVTRSPKSTFSFPVTAGVKVHM